MMANLKSESGLLFVQVQRKSSTESIDIVDTQGAALTIKFFTGHQKLNLVESKRLVI